MTLPALCDSDLHQIVADDEPRIRDIRLGERLGLSRDRDIRRLIKDNEQELQRYGRLRVVRATSHEGSGARIVEEYWLNEAQALLLCMKSEAPRAIDVRQEVITVFLAWRRGHLQPSCDSPIVMTAGAVEKILGHLVDHGREIRGIKDDVADIKYRLANGYKKIQPTVKAEHVDALVKISGGRCPCGCGVIIVTDGQKSPFAEYDHFYCNSKRDASHTWLICKKTHNALTYGRVERSEYEAAFRAYQHARQRLPGRQMAFC